MDPRRLPAPDFAGMDDNALAAEMRQLEHDACVIEMEMQADLEAGSLRGERWRHSAGRARAFKRAHLKLAQAEAERRSAAARAGAKIGAKSEHLARQEALIESKRIAREAEEGLLERKRAEREAAEELRRLSLEAHKVRLAADQARKDAAHAEASAAWERAAARRARMFVLAAERLLDEHERAWLWDAARRMFPEAPDWT